MDYVEFLKTIVFLVLAFLGMPLTQYLKDKLGWDQQAALLLTGAVAAVLGLAQLFLAGDLTLADFTLENFAAVFGMTFTIAQVWYKLLMFGREAAAARADEQRVG